MSLDAGSLVEDIGVGGGGGGLGGDGVGGRGVSRSGEKGSRCGVTGRMGERTNESTFETGVELMVSTTVSCVSLVDEIGCGAGDRSKGVGMVGNEVVGGGVTGRGVVGCALSMAVATESMT